MVFRSDISVNWNLSPRIITVAAPSTELTIQDLHDTLRILEERPWEGLPFPHIIDTAGKEELGGGVTVGLTAKLINAKVAFEGRKLATYTGTITTPDANGRIIIDSNATFITDGILPGAWIINYTDQSKASVIEVLSETSILTDILEGGSDNQFGMNDSYQVQNVVQCEISGGNLVAVEEDLVTSLPAVLSTVGVQITRTSASSATLQELQDIQHSSFNGYVTIDVTSSYSGTVYPTGTPRQPVNNLADALTIANGRGFTSFNIIGDLSITSGTYHGFIFYGESQNKTTITIAALADTEHCEFYECTVAGTLDGGNKLYNCAIDNLSYADGFIENCILTGEISLGAGSSLHLLNCFSGSAAPAHPSINMGGGGTVLNIQGFNGDIEIKNKTGAETATVDLQGKVILASTVTNGTVDIRGIGTVEDNSTGTAVIVTTALMNPDTFFSTLTEAKKYSLLAMLNTS